MSNSVGTIFRITIFGQSHGPAIGVTMEGLPSGFSVNMEKLQAFLNRRAPGRTSLSTGRKETDKPEFISGLHEGKTCGAPVTAVIYNEDCRSTDYEKLAGIPRPGHADYPAMVRYGDAFDRAGGGQFSGRMTAPLCIAGGICLQLLEKRGITVHAEAIRIGGETEPERMKQAVLKAKDCLDSVGGVISCAVEGIPVGVGEPMFDGLENRIAQIVFGIPAAKAIEFGSGFEGCDSTGSENNDCFYKTGNTIKTRGNHHGGILGGMSTGMPLTFRVGLKPTPSIGKQQDSINMGTMENIPLEIAGRHDPCIVYRAIPCVEAAAAIAVYDEICIMERQSP